MKKNIAFLLLLSILLILPASAFCDSMDELIEQFGKEYTSKVPRPNSSVNSDYKLEQTALGAFYTTKTLGLIYKQNQEIQTKYDEMLLKYDEVIEQNKEIIKLLSIISKTKN
ncbi:DUF4296 domain-containing protein [Candidatus Magnetomoraceae bacterium gMMP-1]